MRDFLTAIAIVLIVILTAALAAPYLIDWNGKRGFLEARLSRALGQRVTIGGAIDLKLLPTPYLTLDGTTIGGDNGALTVTIRHLDLELSVAPLLYGEFDIIEARLEEPTIRLTLGRDRTLPALPSAPALAVNVRFDRIDIADGTLAVADPASGRTFVFDHLDLSAEAPSLAGPFKANGSAGEADARTAFRFSTTAAQDGKARLRLVVDETARHPGLDLDGTVASGTGGDHRESFDGALVLSGHAALGPAAHDASPAPRQQNPPQQVAWRLSGPFNAGPRSATLLGGELRLGTEDAGLSLQAQANGVFGDQAKLAFALSAKQLDIDRLSGAPVAAVRPPPPHVPDLAGLRDAMLGAAPSLPTTVDVTVDNATWGGDALSAINAHWTDDGTGSRTLRLAADGPGGSHVEADGALTAAGHGFTGTLEASSDNLPAGLAWLTVVAPDVRPDALTLPTKDIALGARVTATSQGVDADALKVRLGPSTLTGTAHLAFAARARPAKLDLDLHAKTLAAETLPSISALRAAVERYNLDVRLTADSLMLPGDVPLVTGPVNLALTKDGRAVAITRLAAEDLGGATIDGNGRLDAAGAQLHLAVDAARLDTAASLLRRLAPGAASDALAARAPALAPAKLKIDLSLPAPVNGVLAHGRVAVNGRAGGTDVVATVAPTDEGIALAATLDAAEGGTLLRQLGAVTLPLGALGPSRIVVHAGGPAGQPLDTVVSASLGATKLDVTGRYDPVAAGGPTGSGGARLTSPDLTPLLQTLALVFPDTAGHLPADVTGELALDHGDAVARGKGAVAGVAGSGTLRWHPANGDAPALTGSLDLDRLALSSVLALALGPSRPTPQGRASTERFIGGLVDPPRTALTLKVKVLDLPGAPAATGAGVDLGIAPNLLTLKHLSAGLAGGRITGDLELRRAFGDATAEGRITLKEVHVSLPSGDAVASGALDIAGAGSSPSAFLASLAGSGSAEARGLRIAHADPRALAKVFTAIEADGLGVEPDTIVRALDEASPGPLVLGDRQFDLALANGVLHLTQSEHADGSPPREPVAERVDAAYDLQTSRLDEHVRETLPTLPRNWSGAPPSITIGLQGPIENPRRTIDASALIDALATRALARETARIEAYEFDIRERAFFSHRLQSEQRREQDRLKAEDDARRAESERRARAEAARLERLRKEDAARAATLRSDQAIREAIQARGAAAKAIRDQAIENRVIENHANGERAGSEPSDRAAPPGALQDRGSRFEAPPPGSASDPAAAGRY